MKPLRWTNTADKHAYMGMRQQQNRERSRNNAAEQWMAAKLETTGKRWTPQAQWGYRLFDFWCASHGIAVEVDGPEHDAEYDAYRDEYNFRRSGIVVIRVRNFNEADAAFCLWLIADLPTLAERKQQLGIAGKSKKARRVLADADFDDGKRLHAEYIAKLLERFKTAQ